MCAGPSSSRSTCACVWRSRFAAIDAKGDVIEFDIDPRLIEQFGAEASKVIRQFMDQGHQFALVSAPDARPYVRMVTERLFPMLPVLSHLEIARGVQVKSLGNIS